MNPLPIPQPDPEPNPQPELPLTDGDMEPTAVPNDTLHELLYSAVYAIAHRELSDTTCPPDFIPKYAALKTQRICEQIRKFANGQREHGGDFRNCDHLPQLIEEIDDAGEYIIGMLMVRQHVSFTLTK